MGYQCTVQFSQIINQAGRKRGLLANKENKKPVQDQRIRLGPTNVHIGKRLFRDLNIDACMYYKSLIP